MRPIRNDSRFECSMKKNYFIAWVHFSHKTEKFQFRKSFFLNWFSVSCNLFCASFLVTPCLVVAVQPCMEWKKKNTFTFSSLEKTSRQKWTCPMEKSDFSSFSFFGFSLVKKLRNFDFNIIEILQYCVWFGLSFIVSVEFWQ